MSTLIFLIGVMVGTYFLYMYFLEIVGFILLFMFTLFLPLCLIVLALTG